MELTVVQDKYASEVNGVVSYFVRTAVTNAGPLKDTGIMLMAINDLGEATLDTLARVCTVIDFDLYLLDRADAVYNGDIYYRSAENVDQYSNIDTAATGAVSTMEAVDALLKEWNTYYTTFVATGQVTTLPLVDPTVLSTLVTTYQTAVTVTSTAATDNLAAQTTLSAARTSYDNALTVQQTTQDAAASVNALSLQVSPLSDGVGSLATLLTTLGTTPPSGFAASTGEGTAFMRALNDFLTTFKTKMDSIQAELAGAANIPTLQGYVNALYDNSNGTGAYFALTGNTYSPTALTATADSIRGTTLAPANAAKNAAVDTSSVSSALASADTAVVTAGDTLVASTSSAVEKEAAYLKAQTDEAVALAAVVAIDPTYTP